MRNRIVVTALALAAIVLPVSSAYAESLDPGDSVTRSASSRDRSDFKLDKGSKSSGAWTVKDRSGNVLDSEDFDCDGGRLKVTSRVSHGEKVFTFKCS